VAGRRAFVKFAAERKMSTRAACKLVKVSRRRLSYVSGKDDAPLAGVLKALAAAHPGYGSRRLWALLRREGRKVNLKRVRRLCRKHGLTLPARRRRKRRGIGIGQPCQAEHPHHTWAWDFMEDRTEGGRKLRILTVEDEFTRMCLTIEVEYRMNSRFVADTLMGLIAGHGAPRFIRSDNGPEFIAKYLMRLFAVHGIEARHIDPGSPWQNGRNERFNGSVRGECLNMETFASRDHARMICKVYGRQYNTERPHSSLGYLTPAEFADRYAAGHSGNLRGAVKQESGGGGGGRRPPAGPPRGLCPRTPGIYRILRPRLARQTTAGRAIAPDPPAVRRSASALRLLPSIAVSSARTRRR
jgi:putative transposase